MRSVILASILLTLTLAAFGQHSKTGPTTGKTASNSRAKPKPKPKSTPTPDKILEGGLVWVSPCGVYYKNEDDQYISEDKWIFIGQSASDHFWYNTAKMDCDRQTGILKSWIKEMHRYTDLNYALVLYEFKCKAKQLRVKSLIEYDKNGKVLKSNDHEGDPWEDSIPESAGELILNKVCHQL